MKFILREEEWGNRSYFKPEKEIAFDILRKLDYSPHYVGEIDNVEIKIESPKDASEPPAHQIKTLDFVVKNQSIILDSLYKYYRNVIFPSVNTSIKIEEKDIAKNEKELNKIFGLIGLDIPFLKDLDAFYFFLQFEFNYDADHGLYILFRNDSAIGYGNWSAKDYEMIKIYQNESTLDNGLPLQITIICPENNVRHECFRRFDEKIDLDFKKGLYGVHIPWDVPQHFFGFYLESGVQKSSLKDLLTMER